ncbi:unnamed protein product [Phyllotreta striolata]|uniref:NADH dehydrogenase [ubiquinone] 1 beta subcomplex subunit 4 n=1 Tax=Phyllotreta striolata TaxID=444603 RepID=A0A9N9TFG4_PHYSR|nr:unnamed protein product [Phyllotreta striolata]
MSAFNAPDLSQAHREVLEARAKRAAVLREQFLKEKFNPFKHATGEGGTVFDPALQRFQALHVSNFDHFKPTTRTIKGVFGLFIIPFGLTWYLVYTSKNNKEAMYRRGEVAYKDRKFKMA